MNIRGGGIVMISASYESAPLLKLVKSTFLGNFESNTDFRLLLLRYCKNGLIICGVMGIVVTLAYTLAKLHINDYRVAWYYSADHFKGVVVMLDKTIIIAFSVLIIFLARINGKLSTYRGLIFAIALICSAAILIDDMQNRDINFSSGYLTIILLMATICIPYKPWQILSLCFFTSMLYYPGLLFMAEQIGIPELHMPASQIIFFAAITVILTGISSFLYYSRYTLYMVRRTADGLTEHTFFPEYPENQHSETDRVRKLIRSNNLTDNQLLVSEISVPSADQIFLDKVRQVIEDHIADSNFGVEWLAHEVALSPRQLQRRLKASAGLSAGSLIRAMRLQRSAQLLQQRAGNVSEVAYKVGFQDPTYFSKLFRQMFEMNPSEYATNAGNS
jgi:AraC-like DNA-binding protein